MKQISKLLAFATNAFAQSRTDIKPGFHPVKDPLDLKRLVLISFRSPNDQPQLFALPTFRFETARNANLIDFND
jgi:hypothetical protein